MNYRTIMRNLREDRDLTQREVGLVINKSQQGYSHIEDGRAELKIEDLIKLCRFYGVSADYFIGIADAYYQELTALDKNASDYNSRLTEIFGNVTDEAINKVQVSLSTLKDNIFGDGDIDDEENLFRLAEKYANRQNNPRILMCVGKDDFVYQSNVKLKKQFEKLEYDYKYYEDEGMHTWEFWDKQLPIILKWILDK